MTIDPKGFPLDLTGENPRNLVINDERTLATNDDTVFVPDGGPFFTRSLVVKSGTKILLPNVDYKCLHLLRDATVESGLDVSSIVMITNTSISNVNLSYQVIGGQYADTVPAIRQLLENAENIEKSVNWNTHIYAKPDLFPPAPHFVSGEDFSDWAAVLNGMQSIERAILLKDVAAWESAFTYIDNLILHRVGAIDLSNFYTQSQVNGELVKLALKTNVYTKVESNTRHYNKDEVNALIGDIDGNETYYTEAEVNAKFLETIVADAKFATKAELNRVDSVKADKSSVYTRIQSDDKFPLKINVYHKDYIDATFVIKGTSFTKTESDARYAFKTDGYNKVDSDKRYALKSQIPTPVDLSTYITRDEVSSTYLKINTADVVYLRKTTADSTYAKITDLEIIQVLIRKFSEYYTKIECDEIFITNANAHSIFLTKVQANGLYYTKTYVSATYATKRELELEVGTINTSLATKSDTTWVTTNYYNKPESDLRYYTKTDSNNRYYTKQHIDTYFVSNTELARQVGLLTSLVTFNAEVLSIREALDLRYTKAEIIAGYYTRVDSDNLFVRVSTFNSKISVIETELAKKSDVTWVTANHYNKQEMEVRYYTKSMIDSNFYNMTETNRLFVQDSVFRSELNKYTTKVVHLGEMTRIGTELNNRYLKAETYSKSEGDSRFIKYADQQIKIASNNPSTYMTGLVLENPHNEGSSVVWQRSGVNVGMWYVGGGAANEDTRMYLFTKKANNTWGATTHFSEEGIWHSTYGWLHDYFSNRGGVQRDEVYTREQSDARYYTKIEVDGKFVTIAKHDIDIGNIARQLGSKADVSWVTANYYNKVESDNRYYTKSNIDMWFYTKTECDNLFATKSLLASEVAKRVLATTFDATIAQVKGMFENYYTKNVIDGWFASINDMNLRAPTTWVNQYFYSKSYIDNTLYTAAYCNENFLRKADFNNERTYVRNELTNLRRLIETYKVGDLFITTSNFSSSSSVSQHHGYGTWARHAEGRALVGHSPNGWMDGNASSVNEPWWYQGETASIGSRFGTYKHSLQISEMPNHNHTNGIWNRFGASAYDAVQRYGWNGRGYTANGADNKMLPTEWAVMNNSHQMQLDSVTKNVGGNTPHNISQPSITVGIWRRVG